MSETIINPNGLFDYDHVRLINTEARIPTYFESNGHRWIKSYVVEDLADFREVYTDMLLNKKFRVIIIDSFTRFLKFIKDHLRLKKITGYTMWDAYAAIVQEFIDLSLASKKWIVWLGLDNVAYDSDGKVIKTVKIEGKLLSGMIESFFDINLWTYIDSRLPMDKRFKFRTWADGVCPAKTPMGLFGQEEEFIDNDLSIVIKRWSDLAKVPLDDTSIPKPMIFIGGASGSGKSTSLRNLVR